MRKKNVNFPVQSTNRNVNIFIIKYVIRIVRDIISRACYHGSIAHSLPAIDDYIYINFFFFAEKCQKKSAVGSTCI